MRGAPRSIAHALEPDAYLGCNPAANSARPHQLERIEPLPGFIALNDGASDKVSGHRCGVEAVAAEAAGKPEAGPELTDLRHTVERIAQCAGPGVIDGDVPKLGISLLDVGRERPRVAT